MRQWTPIYVNINTPAYLTANLIRILANLDIAKTVDVFEADSRWFREPI